MVVLIVDGNPEARGVRAGLLRAQGHEVMEASTAVEAVHWANSCAALDLLITEVILDTMTFGFDLKDSIQEKFPALVTLYTTRYDLSGYEADMDGASALPATTSDADFLAHVLEKMGRPAHAVVLPPLLPPGTQLGFYQILERLYIERESETYLAYQTTVQRKVALVLLRPELHGDAEMVRDFKERERVKAQLSHPRIAPLYEGKDEHGYIYYTRELPPGRSLDELASKGTLFTERVVTDVLFRVADAMAYATGKGYHYRPLGLRDIYVDDESQASIANIFRPAAPVRRDEQEDVRALLDLIEPFAAQGKARGLLNELGSTPHTWTSLAAKLDDIRSDMSERSLLRRAEDEDLISAVPRKKRWLILGIGAVACILFALLGGLTGKGLGPSKVPPLKAEMIAIPAGNYIVQQGIVELILEPERSDRYAIGANVGPTDYVITLKKPFQISKHEVTIAQYSDFLTALKTGNPRRFDAIDQASKAPSKSPGHKPHDWDAYYAAAATGGRFNKEAISLNSPVTGVDYWDAAAYASFVGQRLPTEVEWELAARGPKGLPYPWGTQPNPIAANLGDDYVPNGKGGSKDGFNLFAPVDAPSLKDDTSPLGICGMAGNVQEWTMTWANHPERDGDRVPLVRGGHFGMKSNAALLTSRHFSRSAEDGTLARGFRTVAN